MSKLRQDSVALHCMRNIEPLLEKLGRSMFNVADDERLSELAGLLLKKFIFRPKIKNNELTRNTGWGYE